MPTKGAGKKKATAGKTKKAPVGKAVTAAKKEVAAKAAGYVKAEPNTKGPTKFTEEEDIFICKALSTVPPILSKGDAFWKKVHAKMYLLYNEDADVAVQQQWSWKSVRNRFQKTISKKVQLFNKYYKQVVEKNENGWTKQMYIDSAMEVWLSIEGNQYKFSDCTRILQQLPKYDPMIEESDDEEGAETAADDDNTEDGDKKPKAKTINKIGHVMGDNQERPIGNKKAKRQKLLDKLEAGSIQSSQAAETVALSSQRMAAAVERRQRHDSWYKRADMFFRMGQTARAREMLERMEQDEMEATGEATNVASIPQAINVTANEEEDDESSDHPSQPSSDSRPKAAAV